ncbi:MAG: hypothetical protein EBT09_02945 [Actinobacteria bacterium]|nr:hypothetical protein [Actinomycetota bacterium]
MAWIMIVMLTNGTNINGTGAFGSCLDGRAFGRAFEGPPHIVLIASVPTKRVTKPIPIVPFGRLGFLGGASYSKQLHYFIEAGLQLFLIRVFFKPVKDIFMHINVKSFCANSLGH